jgi:ribosome modulation factor
MNYTRLFSGKRCAMTAESFRQAYDKDLTGREENNIPYMMHEKRQYFFAKE